MSFTVLIDNYDSFTWNVYQYLCEAGASNVKVFRNDEITIDELEAMQPTHIVISPGPGHPKDAGISCKVIRHFAGKLPILGICLGEQSIYEVFGGSVIHAGEVVHGKTSSISHSAEGIFEGIPQNIKVTRYHSLAGDPETLPDCLTVSCKSDNGIIMAIKHKEFTIEGVQFHPESILSEYGRRMFENFLSVKGGKWSDQTSTFPSILNKIVEKRKFDVEETMKMPGRSLKQLQKYFDMGICDETIDVYSRISQSLTMKIMAEIKRASPSKGDFDTEANAPEKAIEYAKGGASVISILTEPNWFNGSLFDLQLTKHALVKHFGSQRPAILRKDFLFCEYQLLEARLYGADLVLLIVAIIPSFERLVELLKYTRSLGMEALVEVNNAEEMDIALKAGSKIVGVNNRNLNTFTVDMSTTTKLAHQVVDWNAVPSKEQVILVALSGIETKEHVKYFKDCGARAVLVGETLMRSCHPAATINQLLSLVK